MKPGNTKPQQPPTPPTAFGPMVAVSVVQLTGFIPVGSGHRDSLRTGLDCQLYTCQYGVFVYTEVSNFLIPWSQVQKVTL